MPDNRDQEKARDDGESYSTIFKRLVSDPADLVGLVAYGNYKQAKRDWILRHIDKHGERPNGSDLGAFHDHFSDQDLARFRSEAEEMMLAFADTIVQASRPEIEREALDRGLEAAEGRIKAKIAESTRFRDAVLASLAAWIITLGVIILVAIATNFDVVWSALLRSFSLG